MSAPEPPRVRSVIVGAGLAFPTPISTTASATAEATLGATGEAIPVAATDDDAYNDNTVPHVVVQVPSQEEVPEFAWGRRPVPSSPESPPPSLTAPAFSVSPPAPQGPVNSGSPAQVDVPAVTSRPRTPGVLTFPDAARR